MFDKFRRRDATHQNAQRNGKRLEHLGVTANFIDQVHVPIFTEFSEENEMSQRF